MNTLLSLPGLRLLLGAAVGCCAAFLFPESIGVILVSIGVLSGASALVYRSCVPLLWAGLIAAGAYCGTEAQVLPVRVESRCFSSVPAVVQGRIERVLSRDSLSVRCVLHGSVDTRPLRAHRDTRLLLSVVRPDSIEQQLLQPGNCVAASASVRLPRASALPGEFSELLYCSSLGVEWVGRAQGNVALLQPGTSLRIPVQRAADAVTERLVQLFPERSRGMAIALITGDRSYLPAHTAAAFAATGTTHVLAVSGLHVGILAALVLVPLTRLRRPVLRLLIFTLALGAYTVFTGLQPSMLRAAIMAVLAMIAAAAQRESNILNILCSTVLVMLLADPTLLCSTGFHLSVLSLAGLAIVYPQALRVVALFIPARHIGRFVQSSLAATLAASAAVSPVVAWLFSLYSLVSPIANLVVIPLTSLGMVYALCATALSYVNKWSASSFAATADILFAAAEWIAVGLSALPGAVIDGDLAVIAAVCSSAATLYVVRAQTRRCAVFRCGVAITLSVLTAVVLRPVESVLVVPRAQIVAVVIPVHSSRALVLLHDRRATAYAEADRALAAYIDNYSDTTTVIACGAASLRCASLLRHTYVNAVIAQGLVNKQRAQWQALDTLDARGVRVLNAMQWLSRYHSVRLRVQPNTIEWDAWRNTLTVYSAGKKRRLVVPQYMQPSVLQ